jgi:hypothetical protein
MPSLRDWIKRKGNQSQEYWGEIVQHTFRGYRRAGFSVRSESCVYNFKDNIQYWHVIGVFTKGKNDYS